MSMFSSNALPQSATIARATVSRDSTGLNSRTWTTQSSGVACSIQPMGDKLSQEIFGRVGVGNWLGFFEYAVDIQKGDRLYVDSRYFEVMERNNAAGRSHHWEVGLSLWESGNS